MDSRPLQKIQSQEHHDLLQQLETVAEDHALWLDTLLQGLLPGGAPLETELSDQSHREDPLGRWYYGVTDLSISGHPAFAELGGLHVELHHRARALHARRTSGDAVQGSELTPLFQLGQGMRDELRRIKQPLLNQLLVSNRLLGKLFQCAAEGVLIISPEILVLDCNAACSDISGYNPRDLIGGAPDLLYASDSDGELYEDIWIGVRQRGFWSGETRTLRANGTPYLARVAIHAILNPAGEISEFLAIFTDITHVRESEEKLLKLSHFDSITGLPNRNLFQDRLQQEIAHARRSRVRAAILFIDLDNFEQLNQQHGRERCDRLIELLSKRLAALLRSTDSIGRFGGDEFMILVELTSESDYEIVAGKLMEAVRKPFEIDGSKLDVTASVGISLFPNHTSDAQELVRFADLAMYRAKINGKDQFQLYTSSSGG